MQETGPAIDWRGLSLAFVFQGKTQHEIAEMFGISRSTVGDWATGRAHVPWERLKNLVDTRQISWNWLIEGWGPQNRSFSLAPPETDLISFDTPGINLRFLSLFPDKSQLELAEYFGVTQPAVSGWKRFDRQVPWEKLKMVVDSMQLSWEWLLEGCEPKYLT